MAVSRQLVDALPAVALLAIVHLTLNAVAVPLGSRLGLALACSVYFSRIPWDSGDADGRPAIDDRIDAAYDRFLPVEVA